MTVMFSEKSESFFLIMIIVIIYNASIERSANHDEEMIMYIDARLEQKHPALWIRDQNGEARIFFDEEQITQLTESGYIALSELCCRKPEQENQQINELLIGAITLFPQKFAHCMHKENCPFIGPSLC